jgi:hypothetical protein
MSATTTNTNSWGILGRPSPEKIEEYKNMPVGAFQRMVKDLSKKNKGKPLMPHQVWIERRVTDSYVGSVVVSAASISQAMDVAQTQLDQVEFPEEPQFKEVVTHAYHSIDPCRWRNK